MEPTNGRLRVESQSVYITLSPQGLITSVGRPGTSREVSGTTQLAGYPKLASVENREIGNGGIEFKKLVADESGYRQRTIVERFVPTVDSIRWEFEIRCEASPGSYSDRFEDEPWSTAIETRFRYDNAAHAKFWTAWSNPDVTLEKKVQAEQLLGGINARQERDWTDPLTPMPFKNAVLYYGASPWNHSDQNIYVNPVHFDVFCVPIATILEEQDDAGFSLVLSLDDVLLDMSLETDESGDIVFSRTNHRISRSVPVKFSLDIVAHEADWRPGLRWMVSRYPEFFEPVNPMVHEIAGCCSYARRADGFDPDKLKAMGYSVNWNANFDFPYLGLYVPPAASDREEWEGWRWDWVDGVYTGTRWTTSVVDMRDYARQMREMGFSTLNYFNVSEFGLYLNYPFPELSDLEPLGESDWWKDPYRMIHERFCDAVLRRPSGAPYFSWEDCIVLDPGDPVRRQHLLDDARRHIDHIPDSSGIAIDRMDWLRLYNDSADDGVSWICGRPARSGFSSWRSLMSELGPMMHDANRVIFVNNHTKRIDLLREVDAIFCEFATATAALNTTGLLCLRMPGVGFVAGEAYMTPCPDDYIQRYIHLGVFPAAPVPGNDHCLLPSPSIDRLYLDYGPIFRALRGRRWVLEPHAVQVKDCIAKANVFEVNDYYLVIVTFAREPRVRVVLRNLGIDTYGLCSSISPGMPDWVRLGVEQTPEGIAIDVPIDRGCGAVRLPKSR